MTHITTLAELTSFLIISGLAPTGVRGCTNSEIEIIASSFGVSALIPEYREFLREMGTDAGYFLKGSYVYYPKCLDNYEIASEILKNDTEDLGISVALPSESVVFLVHQGYEFYYLNPSDAETGAVFYYCEGDGCFRDVNCTLLQFLSRAAQTEARLLHEQSQ